MKKMIIAVSALGMLGLASQAFADGKATYQQTCFACHGTGAAGAPKAGDKAAWKDRIAKGLPCTNTPSKASRVPRVSCRPRVVAPTCLMTL